MEAHDFHIHQVHFLQLEQNGAPVSNGQYLDPLEIPYWTGTAPYPNVKIRVDFVARRPAISSITAIFSSTRMAA